MRLPYHTYPFSLVASSPGAKLTKGDKGELCAYSVIPYSLLPLCSPNARRHRQLYNGHPRFIYLYAKALCHSSSGCLQSKEGSFKLCPHNITDVLRPCCAVARSCFLLNTHIHTTIYTTLPCCVGRMKQYRRSQLGRTDRSTTNVALSFQQPEAGNSVEGGISSETKISLMRNLRRGRQVLRQQIADHSPQKVLMHENRCSIPSNFSKEKETKKKRGEGKRFCFAFFPSHVASNFNQKLQLVQVHIIRRNTRAAAWN